MANSISILAAGTFVRGNLFSNDMVIVEGGLEGNVVGKKIIIKKGGWIHGDLMCRSLSIELGGMMNGKIKVSQEALQAYLAWSQEKDALPEPVAEVTAIFEEIQV